MGYVEYELDLFYTDVIQWKNLKVDKKVNLRENKNMEEMPFEKQPTKERKDIKNFFRKNKEIITFLTVLGITIGGYHLMKKSGVEIGSPSEAVFGKDKPQMEAKAVPGPVKEKMPPKEAKKEVSEEEISPAPFGELRKQIDIFLSEQEEARKKGLSREEVIVEEGGQFTPEQIKQMEEQIEKLRQENEEAWLSIVRENRAREIEIVESREPVEIDFSTISDEKFGDLIKEKLSQEEKQLPSLPEEHEEKLTGGIPL